MLYRKATKSGWLFFCFSKNIFLYNADMQLTPLSKALQAFCDKKYPMCSADVFILSLPPEKKFGDICINIFPAVKVTKVSPQTLAAEVLEWMECYDWVLPGGNIQGGFVNLFLANSIYADALSHWKIPTWEQRNETVIVDYMGANIGKPLHIGHLCTPLF